MQTLLLKLGCTAQQKVPPLTQERGAFIKQLEDVLSLNSTVALKVEHSSWTDISWRNALLTVRSQNLCELNLRYILTEENVKQLSEVVKTCKQLRVLKVELSDNSECFFHALSDNQSLRKPCIQTTGKMAILLLQTLPSTSVTALSLCSDNGNIYKSSLAFKEYMYIHGRKVLTVLRVSRCCLTDEAFNFYEGLSFILNDNYEVRKGWTELFNSLCLSCITTLELRNNNRLNGEEE